MITIKTNLATSAPILAETIGDLNGIYRIKEHPEVRILEKFSGDATAALDSYRKDNLEPTPGREIPLATECTADDVTELMDTLDHIFMTPPSPIRDILEKKYGSKEMQRRQGILYTFCYDLRKHFGI